jgi:putative hemolysin
MELAQSIHTLPLNPVPLAGVLPTLSPLKKAMSEVQKTEPTETKGANLQVSLASPSDLEEIYRLRYEVFFEELKAHDLLCDLLRKDQDQFDAISDHLVVKDRQSNRVVGTYRMMPWNRLKSQGLSTYCAQEFDLTYFPGATSGQILELGRSCVHPQYRQGTVPLLLWGGLAQYIQINGFSGLLGCVSVYGVNDIQALKLAQYLQKTGNWAQGIQCPARLPLPEIDSQKMESEILPSLPPLFKGYLNLGAKVCGGPVFDPSFGCHDFLVYLDMAQVNPRTLNVLSKVSSGFTASFQSRGHCGDQWEG